MERAVGKIRKLAEFLVKAEEGGLTGDIISEITKILTELENEAESQTVRKLASSVKAVVENIKGNSIDYELSELLFKAVDAMAISVEKGTDEPAEEVLKALEEKTKGEDRTGEEKTETKADPELFSIFKGEALDLLEKIESGIEGLSHEFSEERAKELMRYAHTVKGSSRIVGITDITDLAYSLENLFSRAIKEKRPLGRDGKEAALEIKDAIEALISGDRLDRKKLEELIKKSETVKLGEKPETCGATFTETEEETVRLPVRKLEDVVKKAAELKIYAGKGFDFEKLVRDIEKSLESLEEALREKSTLKEVKKHIERLKNSFYSTQPLLIYHIEKLLESVESLRMFPFKVISALFPRMVRESAHSLGKRVDFKVVGEDVEVDKEILERLRDPLVHLLRNAVDHGIEDPQERESAGKDPVGHITLRAYRRGDELVVEVEDDGRGIDPKEVLKKAREKGINVPEEDPLSALFIPGFSTKDGVSEFSGRGVGLDVVKETVEKLGGRVELKSEKGKGTCVRMFIPLNRSVVKGLVVEIGKALFMLPIRNVERVDKVSAESIKTIEGMSYMETRGEGIEVFHPFGGKIEGKVVSVVTVKSANKTFGVVVDSVKGIYETVVSFSQEDVIVEGYGILPDNRVAQVLNTARFLEYLKKSGSPISFKEKSAKRPKEILVVDDSITTRAMMKTLLEGEGFSVDLAKDGVEALEKLKEKSYLLALVDIEMPRMDGFSLTKRIKSDKNLKDMPVVILTSRGGEEDLKKGMEAGADAYFVKARFDRDEFLETVRRFL